MRQKKPVDKPKSDYSEIIGKISQPDSPVGIDAQYTHAVIIDHLQRIEARLEMLERLIMDDKNEKSAS